MKILENSGNKFDRIPELINHIADLQFLIIDFDNFMNENDFF